MEIKTKFSIGQIVYLKTDPDQFPRIVTCIKINPYDHTYTLNKGPEYSDHYDMEMTAKRDQAVLMGVDASDTEKQ